MFTAIKAFFSQRKKLPATLQWDDAELYYFDGIQKRAEFFWCDVVRVVTYKDDVFTVDLICLEFELRAGKKVMVHEDMSGFNSLVKFLPQKLTIKNQKWLHQVRQPAIARNFQVIFEKNQ